MTRKRGAKGEGKSPPALIEGREPLSPGAGELGILADQFPSMALFRCGWNGAGKLEFRQLSAGIKDLCGVTAEEILRDSARLLACFSAEDVAEWRSGMTLAASEKRLHLFEVQVEPFQGISRWVQIRSVLRQTSKNAMVFDGMMLDITAQKELEMELRRRAEGLQEAQRIAVMGTWEMDVATGKASWSDQIYDMFGLERGGPIPDWKGHEALLPERDFQKLHEAVQQAVNLGKSYELQLEFRKANGESGFMLAHGKPVFGPEGKVVRLIGTAIDLTAREAATRAEAAMVRVESVGQLAAGIAHDFNNYLATLNLGFELIRSVQKEGLEEEFKVIKATLDAAKRLTNQLLTLSKGGRPVKVQLDVERMLRETAEFVFRGTSVECRWIFSAGLPRIFADSDQIQQVFSNILINARQAMGDSGCVQIEAEVEIVGIGNEIKLEPGSYVKIGIEDQGGGILPEHLSRIYEPYFSTKSGGSGLGLAVAYRILLSHGGGLQCQSVPGKGTLFEMYLPAASVSVSMEEGRGVSSAKAAATPRCRVLILDDEPFMLKCLGQYLRKLGHTVGEAKIGEECLERYEEALAEGKPYDVLILDITIKGGMGGVETLTELIRRHPGVKAIASSGYSKQGILSHYEEYGFSAALPKPYSVEKLREVLHQVVVGKAE